MEEMEKKCDKVHITSRSISYCDLSRKQMQNICTFCIVQSVLKGDRGNDD